MANGFDALTKAELMDMAEKKKIKVSSSMKKDEIIAALESAGVGSAKKPATASKKPAAAAKSAAKPAAPEKKTATAVKKSAAVKAAPAKEPVASAKKAVPAKSAAKPAATAAAKPAKPDVAPTKVAAKAATVEKKVESKPAAAKAPEVKAKAAPVAAAPSAPKAEAKPAVVKAPPAPLAVAKPAAAKAAIAKDEVKPAPVAKAAEAAPKPASAPAKPKEQVVPASAAKTSAPAKASTSNNRKATPAKPQEVKPAAAEALRKSAILKGNGSRKSWDIKIDEKKFFIADEVQDYAKPAPALPENYGETRIVALVRDPFKLYIYWEFQGDAVERAKNALGSGWENLKWILRVLDVTGVDSEDGSANRWFDAEVDPASGSRYLDVDRADCEYQVALGLVNNEGRFAAIAVSNRARTPRAEVSQSHDLMWMAPEETMARLYGLSGSGRVGVGSGESSMLGIPLGEVSSAGVSSFSAVSSYQVSSFGASEQMAKGPKRGFFFWLDCELIVYGGTEPDATVHMMGRKINLRPDGTFTARFFLPDGIRDIPVTAQSSDGVERREISPTVTRATRRKDEFLISEEEWAAKQG